VGDIVLLLAERVEQFRKRMGRGPAVILVHPQRLPEVVRVLPLARTRQRDEPLPKLHDIIIG
jgi:hypothetical protein